MSISIMSAAATACNTRDWRLSNLELQKLLYLAHMKFIGTHGGAPLIREDFEAWKFGPVVSRLYHRVSKFGDGPISDVFNVNRNLALPEHQTIKDAVNQFRDKTPGELVELTHRPGGAWDSYYMPRVSHIRIPNAAILTEYRRNPF